VQNKSDSLYVLEIIWSKSQPLSQYTFVCLYVETREDEMLKIIQLWILDICNPDFSPWFTHHNCTKWRAVVYKSAAICREQCSKAANLPSRHNLRLVLMAFSLQGLKQDKFLPFSSHADNSLHHLGKKWMANFHR
jgi:hypothetical protein